MKTKILNASIALLLLFSISSCDDKKESTPVVTDSDCIDLSVLDTIPKYDLTDGTKLYFNLDLSYKDFQVIHLSSDLRYTPFVVVCKVNANPDPQETDKYVINKFELGVRSINKNPETYYHFKSDAEITNFTEDNYKYKISANIDVNTTQPRLSVARIASDLKKVSRGDKMEVKIDPKILLNSLNAINAENDKALHRFIEDMNICCDGAICSLRLVF
ncbi:hypothetical protein [Psychroserpens sp. SPM9]|uniref:hypothetical protein n=1 Tax=Psychroserpens sp. SPM9 TaxID=2975598 RepID=UPI0021A7AF0F|nr:hypothetical protein [Psychroserpens sp. SPM9]MDG5492547.1 hypothetical protein [Psychroserpens sp. SPM9]